MATLKTTNNMKLFLFIVLLGASFSAVAQPQACFTYLYYISSNGQFIESSSELIMGEKVQTTSRDCLTGENAPPPPAFEKIDYNEVEPFIIQASNDFDVNPNLIRAVIQVESGYRPTAVSPKGAKGLMQLMDATGEQYDLTDPFDPDSNIYAGTNHLSDLLTQFDGNVEYSLAAYNAGANAVIRNNGIPPFEETQEYVKKVVNFYTILEDSEKSPQTASDRIERIVEAGDNLLVGVKKAAQGVLSDLEVKSTDTSDPVESEQQHAEIEPVELKPIGAE